MADGRIEIDSVTLNEKAKSTPKSHRIGRPVRDTGPTDCVIIGSGISALSCAAILSRMGKRVVVLEQHYTAGGFTHCFEHDGFEFGTGLHYVGQMEEGHVVRSLFDFISNDALQWESMGTVYDRFKIAGKTYDVHAKRKAFRDTFLKRFPEERSVIDRYLEKVAAVDSWVRHAFLIGKLCSPRTAKLIAPLIELARPSDAGDTSLNVLRSLTTNSELIGVLLGQWGGCGTPPAQMSFMMHAGAVEHYMNGAYYPVGGSTQIARTIVPVIESAGGHVFTNARVSRLLIEGRRAIGVELDNGHRIFADSVVSSIGVLNTCRRLLDPETRSTMGFDRCEAKLLPSSAHLGLFLGLSKSAEELGLPKTNLWLQPAFDHDATYREHWRDLEQPFPLVYFTFPSAKDPRFQERYPGKATIEIIVPTNHEHFARWADTSWQKRGDEYLQVKRRLFERVMEIVLQELPQIRGHVAHVDFSTPLTTQHFNRAPHGEIYGLAHTPWRYSQEWLRPDTPLRSFYMTGQDIFFMGIGPSAVSGFLTAMRILGARGRLRLLVKLKWPRTSR